MTAPKQSSSFYTGVRNRGLLNAMLDTPALEFEKANPGQRCKWEYMPLSGDMSFVGMREAQGLRLVKAEELGPQTESQQKEGLVRRGDLVLMAGPEALLNELEAADAQRADDEYKTPETAYKEHLSNQQYKTATGERRPGKPFGKITRQFEEINPPTTEEGGETS